MRVCAQILAKSFNEVRVGKGADRIGMRCTAGTEMNG
jgi:hypothetical protein